MKFSVIIPCYNASGTIARALDSLVFQPYKDWEAICIDDCSKDNTIEVIGAYIEQHKDSHITLLRHEKNSGPGVSRNHGIGFAKGEYLCFLDSDDYYTHSTFQVLDEKIGETNPDIIFYGCNQIIGNTIRKRPVVRRRDISEYMALVGGSFWGGLWRRSLWADIEIPAISNAEDIAVIPVLISRAKRIEVVDNLLYNYVHSNNSISSRHHPQVSYNFASSFRYTLQHIDVKRFKASVEFHGIKTIIYGATLNALKAGMSNNEIKDLWEEFEDNFPHWINNKYLESYSRSKRLFVKLASYRCFLLMRCYARLHSVLLKLLG